MENEKKLVKIKTPVKSSSKMQKKQKNPFIRAKSLIGPQPDCMFGPKASTQKEELYRQYEIDPYDQRLKWSRPPENVLVIKRNDSDVNTSFKQLVTWLVIQKQLKVFVEKKLHENTAFMDAGFRKIHEQLKSSFKTDDIDLVICLGGDGTLLYAASLFQESMPPIIAFHSGSLGFLTSHSFATYRKTISQVLEGNAILMLRSRLRCNVERAKVPALNGIQENGESGLDLNANADINRESECSYLVLNEVVVDRGSNHYLCNIDLYLENRRITSVQGDGLIISTPTGSTAYAVAAGASMVHPNVPSIMITPVCPHSLSFRPIIVPAGVTLAFTVSKNARGPVSVCFDGRAGVVIDKGDYVTIRTSIHPTPCVCKVNPFDDWFDSLSECLHWNSRQEQKKYVSENLDDTD